MGCEGGMMGCLAALEETPLSYSTASFVFVSLCG